VAEGALRKLLFWSTGCGILLSAFPAHAQPGRDIRAEEVDDAIIVTARKREERVEDVPFAITVLGAEALAARRIDDTLSLFRNVPGLSLTSFDDGRFAYFQLRGIGPLTQALSPDDASVVTYVDGVPQPVYASEFAYLDLERVEVLKGPQGTLYGRNAQAGAISIVTRQPGSAPEAAVRLEARESDHWLGQASASGPLSSDRLAASIAARVSTIGGYVRNVAPIGGDLGDRDSYAGRVSFVLTPSGANVGGPRLVLTANADRQLTEPYFYARRPAPQPPIVSVDPVNQSRRTLFGISLTADVPLGGAVLTSVTAFNGYRYRFLADDTDGLLYGPLFGGLPPAAFLPPTDQSSWREKERRFYQELRVASRPEAATAWVAGASYFTSDFDALLKNRSSFSPFLNGDRDNEQRIDSYALFGETTVPLGSPRLKGTVGARYTRDDKTYIGRFTGVGFPGTVDRFDEREERSYDLLTGRAALSWEASDDATFYATVARGAKSGAFPRFTLNAALGNASPSYSKSTSWSYETGFKGQAGRVGFDMAAFYNDVNNEQLFILDFVSFQFLPANLDTRSIGVEAQARVQLAPGLDLSGGLAWIDAEIRESGPSGAARGNRVPNVPRWSSNATLSWRGADGLFGNAQAAPILTLTHQYAGGRSVDVAESFFLPSYHNVDARVGVSFGTLDVYAFGRNLTNDTQQLNGVLYGPGVEGAAYARGRTIGAGLTGRF